ncbi:MAG: glycosyltransferase family 4 protein [Gloeomargarita sp. SKYBB_i_bin120]|nr:glycosyltransferase family 4 protein [Gloeomargarita sp. SKYG98]MCS7293404.1 glycosyltransferase family 4 protein [Gloeomargarita sp. SKYB120]MDW8178970.1 glycosyltransferase family 4 protein [Gloeomargarita sp. SKYBB_i_bin120]
MRVCIVTGIFPPDVGGPATYVPLIAQGLQALGHHVQVVTSSEPQHLTGPDACWPFPVVRLNRRVPWLLRSLYYQRHLALHVAAADVVYVNGLLWEAAQVCRRLHKPWVAKVVGDSTWERAVRRRWTQADLETFQAPQRDFRVRLFRHWRNQALRQAQRVIVPSHYLARLVRGWGVPAEKIAVIYNAMPLPSTLPTVVNPLTTRYRVLTAGRLVPWKQVDEIITAIAPLTDVGLVVVGSGPEQDRLAQQVQALELTPRVYFAGQKPLPELLALMQTCDVLVLNSTYEGLPHVVLEAMAVGLPVIATAVGGTPELIQDGYNGRLIPPHRPDILRHVLWDCLTQPELRQQYRQKAQQSLGPFQFQTMIQRCAAILTEVATISKGGTG